MEDMISLVEELNIWAKSHRIEECAGKDFLSFLECYQKKEPIEFTHIFPNFSRDYLNVEVTKLSLVLPYPPEPDNPSEDPYSYVLVHLPIIYQHREIGWYKVMYKISGEYITDIISFA